MHVLMLHMVESLYRIQAVLILDGKSQRKLNLINHNIATYS